MGDHGDEIRVPLYYSPREKFIENRASNPSIESTAFNEIFPAIGFELASMNFAPERQLNPLARIENVYADDNMIRSFNRVPYDLTFSVTVGAKRFEDLPAEARAYIATLEEVCGVPVALISTGSDRLETILRSDSVAARWFTLPA